MGGTGRKSPAESTAVRSKGANRTLPERREYIRKTVRGQGPSSTIETLSKEEPGAATDSQLPDSESRVVAATSGGIRRREPNWLQRHWIETLLATLLGFAVLMLANLNREVGELTEKQEALRSDLASVSERLTRSEERASEAIDRQADRIELLTDRLQTTREELNKLDGATSGRSARSQGSSRR